MRVRFIGGGVIGWPAIGPVDIGPVEIGPVETARGGPQPHGRFVAQATRPDPVNASSGEHRK